ncbi:hypothetical protein PVAND_016216 [Polypedilum vanderplanki]|uniref:Uncharacterized protein n=1 Tax=Polypedilum vanderplanki TaxID=319348 RepID=A0A9J6BET1_POLVA|nr:hypothetical protein PVAND_016216 [Polypedilum vanderplanki]
MTQKNKITPKAVIKPKNLELEKVSLNSTLRDFLFLSISFLFTILISFCIILYINNQQQQFFNEIETIHTKFAQINLKFEDLKRSHRSYARKGDIFTENLRLKRAISVFQSTEGPAVEFFDPKLRPELEKNDSLIMKKNNWKGAAPKGDNWVWMTAYSRIPFEAIDGFCKQTKDYCPPGPNGAKGDMGPVGLPGSPGMPGQKGQKGEIGPVGPPGLSLRGVPGIKGNPGARGLDGLDGIPGEPGLDGSPGRAGENGKPGKDGRDGLDGKNGQDGKNGTNGSPGVQGPKGDPGPKGDTGMTGPRGPQGFHGRNGKDGEPSTCMHTCEKVNGTFTDDKLYYIGASIPVIETEQPKVIVVTEKDNVRLRCAATGIPEPIIRWERNINGTIDTGEWKANSITNNVLNFTKINRVHSGVYTCIAYNGIGSPSTYQYKIEVQFKPVVRIRHRSDQQVKMELHKSVNISCESDAFPEPVMYWQREDGTVIENDFRHRIEQRNDSIYTSVLTLTITRILDTDINRQYHCVSKNLLGIARIIFYSSLSHGIVNKEGDEPLLSGELPPSIESYEKLCPAPPPCEKCPTIKDLKCKDTIQSLSDLIEKDFKVSVTGNKTEYKPLGNRTYNCELGMVGKPVFYKYLDVPRGAWMRDPVAIENVTVQKVWITKENDQNTLYEYKSKEEYQKDFKPKKYILNCAIKGNAHIVYNNNFYYYCGTEEKIYRYDLKAEKVAISAELEFHNTSHLLYTTKYNVVDFNVDENGLWVIHSAKDSNYTIVSKLNDTTLEVVSSLNITVFHDKLGEMFILCGILYGVDSTTARHTKIRFALDLYSDKENNDKLLDVDIPFANPFNSTSTIGYNHHLKELYTWANGNQLTYLVQINALGTNATNENDDFEKSLRRAVGYSVLRASVKNDKIKGEM